MGGPALWLLFPYPRILWADPYPPIEWPPNRLLPIILLRGLVPPTILWAYKIVGGPPTI